MNPYRENKFHTKIIWIMLIYLIILVVVMVYLKHRAIRLFTISAFLPFLFYAISIKCMAHFWSKLEPEDIKFAKEFGFPDFGADYYISCEMCTRKMSIWYTLFIITWILTFLLPVVGRIAFWVSQAVLILFFVGQSIGVSSAKSVLKSLNPAIQRNYRPIVNIMRIPEIYQFVLIIIFATVFNLATS